MIKDEELSLELWPFILPLPKKKWMQYKILLSAFGSKVAFSILKNLKIEGKTYQKDLLKKLTQHSNKSILNYLKLFVEAKILEEGMEQSKIEGKTAWIKWYKPTFLGKWLILLLTSPKKLSKDEIKEMSRDFLKFYAKNLAKFCSEYEIDPEEFKKIFEEALKESKK
jgi:hypothetical protein